MHSLERRPYTEDHLVAKATKNYEQDDNHDNSNQSRAHEESGMHHCADLSQTAGPKDKTSPELEGITHTYGTHGHSSKAAILQRISIMWATSYEKGKSLAKSHKYFLIDKFQTDTNK